MAPASRKVVFAVLASFALLAVGCESNNKGKIVGKWRVTSSPGGDAPAGVDAGTFFEFAADGTFRVYESFGPLTADKIKGKYSLGAGDTVNMSDIDPAIDGKNRSREKITISDDNMTIAGEGGKTTTLTRVK